MLTEAGLSHIAHGVREACAGGHRRIAVLGVTGSTGVVVGCLQAAGFADQLAFVLSDVHLGHETSVNGVPVAALGVAPLAPSDVLVVAADAEKESLLRRFAQAYPGLLLDVVIGGVGHLEFRSPIYRQAVNAILPPSLANGYPWSLAHLYQCLESVAQRRLLGAIVEFGAFRGGTSAFLATAARLLGHDAKFYAFETFAGFPERSHPFDMYSHPDLLFTDRGSVETYLRSLGVELVVGDIKETATILRDEPLALSFVDTDNYSSAAAALNVAVRNTVVGGMIVLDHYTGGERFRYTLGERMAADDLIPREAFLNLHATGVFIRLS